MSDPTLKRTSVQIKYTGSDGYRSEFTAKGGAGTAHRVTGEEVPPQRALLAAIEELSRLTSLFGFEREARAAFDGSAAAVQDWRNKRAAIRARSAV